MKIKTKLNIGVGLLFTMILLLAVISGWYINRLKKDTGNILEANYNTLEYSRNMLLAMEEINSDSLAFGVFEKHLSQQQKNVTEPGEKEVTDKITSHFSALKIHRDEVQLQSKIRKDISELMQLNMNAIRQKSSIAEETAKQAIFVISVSGTLCFLIAFILLVNLPANIADPIKALTVSIREIANQNYRERLHFKSNSEFGDLSHSFNVMAEKLQEYSESKLGKILEGKKRIETLIDNMHDPVIGIDEKNRVLFVNDEALKIANLSRENFVGKNIHEVAVNNDLIRNIIKDDAENPMKIYANNKESYFEKETVDINIIPTGESETQFIGKVLMLRNITPFKELDLAKTNFMGTVSHEFKTPISSIKMGVDLLQNEKIGNLNSEQNNLVNGIKDDANRLLKITGELLNITQVESGSVKLNIQPSHVLDIVQYALEANKSSAEQKNITITTKIDEDAKTVMADSEKTSWVLNNLLSNAIRYSYENSQIRIAVTKKLDAIIFSVEDFGQGIAPEYIEKVFDRYFRIPGSKKEGTGLGLSISKEFIESQNGKISVESEFGKGSVFSFSLHS